VLLFAKDPLYFMPGAYVQYVRYEGDSQSSEVQEERRLVGDLLSICRDLDRLASEIAEARPSMTAELTDKMVYDYPPRAMHELFMNAVIHRNYEGSTAPIMINHFSDRIEVQNVGGLYGELTVEKFPFSTAYRNPVIAEAAKTLGFVNRFGRGIAVVKSQLQANGSPPPEFNLEANHFLVVVRRRP
jgi:ATP-dependent DNA helicase RecG